jgi:putative SOS response-associated peptidase YedK
VPPGHFDRWLDCKANSPREVADLLAAAPDDLFEAIPVGPAVNRVANNSPDIQKRVEPAGAAPAATRAAPPKPAGSQGKLF